MQQWACQPGNANQHWQFQPTDNGYYKVIGRTSSTAAWDVAGGPGAGNGSKIQLWAYGAGSNQQWKPVTGTNGTYTLTPRSNSNACLDVTDGSTSNGARLQQWTCTGGPAQSFTLTPQWLWAIPSSDDSPSGRPHAVGARRRLWPRVGHGVQPSSRCRASG